VVGTPIATHEGISSHGFGESLTMGKVKWTGDDPFCLGGDSGALIYTVLRGVKLPIHRRPPQSCLAPAVVTCSKPSTLIRCAGLTVGVRGPERGGWCETIVNLSLALNITIVCN
jgi:hypothetical protein